ncbi:MAG: YbaN family protein [Burkholderiales bacterium]
MTIEPMTPDEPGKRHPSAPVRWLLIAAGLTAVALGVIGAFLPVLPTTPFMLLAAACFARASPKLDRMLTESKMFGPTILEWRAHRSMPWRTKLVAIGLMSGMIALSATLFVEPWWAKAVLVAVGVATGAWMWSIPSRDRPARSR